MSVEIDVTGPGGETVRIGLSISITSITAPAVSVPTFESAVPDPAFRAVLSAQNIDDLATLAAATELFVGPNPDIQTMEGVQYATGLMTLEVYNCPLLTMIPSLAAMTSLAATSGQYVYFGLLPALATAPRFIGEGGGMANLQLNSGEFSQAQVEAFIDSLWPDRALLGANACWIDLSDNPGSAAAAISRVTQIADLTAAGCTVQI
jgi:hypothetical protein